MAALIISLLIGVVGLLAAWLTYLSSTSKREKQKQKLKEQIDEAIRTGDNDALAFFLSEHFNRVRTKNKDNPGQQGNS